MKKKLLTVILSVVATAGIATALIFAFKGYSSKEKGTILVNVIDLDQTLIKEKNIRFNEGDKLNALVSSNFDNVTIDNGMIMTIETLVTPTDWSSFICIYINDEMSNYGIMDLPFKDGDKISFIMTEFIYE